MEFRTEIRLPSHSQGLINHERPVLLLGSCFSDNIGRELTADLFDTLVNPFGPLYNPRSILRILQLVRDREETARICREGDRWFSYDAHSKISAHDEYSLRESFRRALSQTRSFLSRKPVVIITLGTTRIFTLLSDETVVANCHKQSGRLFRESMLTLGETVDTLSSIVTTVREMSHDSDILFTVSPLRYPSADPHSNTLSKSILHLAVDETVGRFERVEYFPVFEIMMDDLRDYRFYADDMRHPSGKAVEYIYEKFSQTFFEEETLGIARQARRLSRRSMHRRNSPLDMESWPEMTVLRDYPQLKEAFNRFLNDGV